uniref:Uncharacterized protein n=1 Tax=Oryza nivara TaxID=4536 RepID=A0A0E0HWY2_ORYNI
MLAAEEHEDDVVVVVVALGNDGEATRPPRALPTTAGAAGGQIRPLRRRIWHPRPATARGGGCQGGRRWERWAAG